MQKNVASQKLIVFAFNTTTNAPVTGDAANITAYVSIDWGAVTVLGDTAATEMDATNAKGYYLFDLTQAESNGNTLLFSAKSSTANVVVVGAPACIQTVPASFIVAPGSAGALFIGGSNAATTTASLTTGAIAATTITASGAVAFQSTFAVTTSTNLAALSCSTFAASGTVTFNAFTVTNNLLVSGNSTVTGTTTYTGAITGSNASNNLAVNTTKTAGVTLYDSDFTIASATASTIVLPATYTDTSSLPDDDRYVYTAFLVVAGTGQGQVVITQAAAAGARTYDVLSGTMPVQLDNTSKCVILSSVQTSVAAASIRSAVGLASANLDTQLDALPTAAEVWAAGTRTLTAGTNIQLPSNGLANVTAWTVAITGNITGNLSGSAGSVTGAVGSVAGAVASVTGSVGSVTGLTASDVAAIKAKTDSLGFTVAGQVDSNVQYVNDVQVNGVGTTGNPWGP